MTKQQRLSLLAVLVIVAALVLIQLTQPAPKQHAEDRARPLPVEIQLITPQPYQVMIRSYGSIQPRIQSSLYPQVAGQIIEVSENFRAGGFFRNGDILLTIEPRDYAIALDQAKLAVAEARLNLAEEQARAEQAQTDWQRLQLQGDAGELVLRKPQLEVAEAQLAAAQASEQQAQLNLERTRVRAPFSGRVREQQVDVGQRVSTTTQLATLYASDAVEVALPVNSSDLAFIDDSLLQADAPTTTSVTLYNALGSPVQRWHGRIIRSEAALDATTQQLQLIARIEQPFQPGNGLRPLKIGQYVRAEIAGRQMGNALLIPNQAVYQGSYVYLLVDGALQRREIQLSWQNDSEALVSAGLSAGEQLVISPLGRVVSGTAAVAASQQENTTP